MKATQLTAAFVLLGLTGGGVTSCVIKDEPSTDLGSDNKSGSGSGAQPASSGSAGVVPHGQGMTAQNGGAAGTPVSSSEAGAMGDAGPSSGGAPDVTGIVNADGFSLEDSFIITPCRVRDGWRCYEMEGVTDIAQCPRDNSDGASPLDQGWRHEQEFQLGGELGKTYDVTVAVNGVVEAKLYVGGTRRTAEVDADVEEGITDAFYTGGQAPASNYNVYQLSVFEADGETEVQHYFLNSFPATAYESHRTFLIAYEATITVPGQGIIRYLNQDSSCFAVDNCGPGNVPDDESCPFPRQVPNEPDLVLPETFGGEPLSALYPGYVSGEPWHSQLIHITVTNVVENP